MVEAASASLVTQTKIGGSFEPPIFIYKLFELLYRFRKANVINMRDNISICFILLCISSFALVFRSIYCVFGSINCYEIISPLTLEELYHILRIFQSGNYPSSEVSK